MKNLLLYFYWNNTQHLKTYSPFGLAKKEDLLQKDVEHVSLSFCSNNAMTFCGRVFFETKLSTYIKKNTQHLEYLSQIAMEIIHYIPEDALQIYTEGSRRYISISGGRMFSKLGYDIRNCRKKPDYSTVSRAKLIAIEEILKDCANENVNSER